MKLSYKKIIVSVALFVIITSGGILGAHAAISDNYTPLAPLPNISGTSLTIAKSVSFKDYVQYIFNLLIALGAVAAVFEITWGGFEYMTSDAVQGKTEGLKRIQNAIYGLLLVLSSYLILKTIDPRFVNIPASLVAPLGLTASNQIADLASRASSEITSYNTDQSAVRDTLAANNAQIAQLQTQTDSNAATIRELVGASDSDSIDTICADNSSSQADIGVDPDPALTDACNSYYNVQNQQTNLQSSTTLLAREGVLDGYVAACGTTASTGAQSCYTTNLANINSYYARNSAGLTPGDQSTLQNYAQAARVNLIMDSWLSYYDAVVTNYNNPGASSSSFVWGALTAFNTWLATPLSFGSREADVQYAQTLSLSNIDQALESAQTTVTDQTMYQQLVSNGTSLKSQISSLNISM